MINQKLVREIHPQAVADRAPFGIVILRYPKLNGAFPPILGTGGTEEIAWENARINVVRCTNAA